MDEYSIKIARGGLADAPETCRCKTTEAAAAIVQAILASRDSQLEAITVFVVRVRAV